MIQGHPRSAQASASSLQPSDELDLGRFHTKYHANRFGLITGHGHRWHLLQQSQHYARYLAKSWALHLLHKNPAEDNMIRQLSGMMHIAARLRKVKCFISGEEYFSEDRPDALARSQQQPPSDTVRNRPLHP